MANYSAAGMHLIKDSYEQQDKVFIYHLLSLFAHLLNPNALVDGCHSFITLSIPSSKRCHFSHRGNTLLGTADCV